MTVFWSDPTTIRVTLPAGDELEDEYYAPPRTAGNTFTDLGIVGPGVAEIKAHNYEGIAGAIAQLSRKIELPRPSRGGPQPTNWDVAATRLAHRPSDLARIIITYRPTGWDPRNPRGTPSPLTVDVYAVRFEHGRGVAHYSRTAKWVLVRQGVRVPPRVPVTLDDRGVFGAVVEGPVRRAFADALLRVGRQPYNLGKSAADAGPDATWTEIAEMYAELARGTNDEFLAALANELATPG